MVKSISLIIVVCFVLPTPCFGKHKHSERYYIEKYCQGVKEKVLDDRSRCDCITSTHAIEYEFANNWKEGIGQSLNYAFYTNLKAGIVLILERKKDLRHLLHLNSIIEYYRLPITVYELKAYE